MHLLSTTIVEIDVLSTVTVVVKSELQLDDIMGNDHVTINETTRPWHESMLTSYHFANLSQ